MTAHSGTTFGTALGAAIIALALAQGCRPAGSNAPTSGAKSAAPAGSAPQAVPASDAAATDEAAAVEVLSPEEAAMNAAAEITPENADAYFEALQHEIEAGESAEAGGGAGEGGTSP